MYSEKLECNWNPCIKTESLNAFSITYGCTLFFENSLRIWKECTRNLQPLVHYKNTIIPQLTILVVYSIQCVSQLNFQ